MEPTALTADYQGFHVKVFEGLPHESVLHVDRPRPGLAPELMACGASSYADLKREQLQTAAVAPPRSRRASPIRRRRWPRRRTESASTGAGSTTRAR